MSESCLLRESNPEYKARKIAGQTGTTRTITDKLKASHATHSQWMKDQYAAGTGWAQKVLFAVSPNKLEQYMIEHLQPLGWEFVGDGQVWIVGKNPDFIHRRAHRLLEIFGDYWHRNDDSQERIDHFAKYGWACTVIWESAIKKDIAQVLKQL
jgi:G:T-mismatch repair DNA endonuclease (very short patch repair protein)